jgi:predicted DNA-binding protein with PD1-like motif
VMKGLLAFARKHKLVAGQLTGIGAVSDAIIGYFDPKTKTYLRNHENRQAEVLSLTGNLALYDNEPFLHVHVALGQRDGSAQGGHLFEARARPTLELVLSTYRTPVQRTIDPESGLPLIDPWGDEGRLTWRTRTTARARSRSGRSDAPAPGFRH